MDTKANIRWIKSELDNVDDPMLIESIIKLLKSRRDQSDQEMDEMIREAEQDVSEGRIMDQHSLRERMKTWRK